MENIIDLLKLNNSLKIRLSSNKVNVSLNFKLDDFNTKLLIDYDFNQFINDHSKDFKKEECTSNAVSIILKGNEAIKFLSLYETYIEKGKCNFELFLKAFDLLSKSDRTTVEVYVYSFQDYS